MKKIADKLGIGNKKDTEKSSSEGTSSKRQSRIIPQTTSTPTASQTNKPNVSDPKMSQIPKTMKAACLVAANKPLEIKEIPVPEMQPGEILIKVHACGVCHSDAHVLHGDMGPP